MKIFSGSSNRLLVELICQRLEIPLGDVYLKAFPSGERYCQFQENIRGCDVFLVQSNSNPVNDYLMELLVMCDAARRASAERITAVIPYFGYARQDRKDKSRVPISGKLVMDLLQAAGVDRILTMDLHSPQTVGFTNMPVDQLGFRPALINAIKSEGVEVVVSPDIGAVKRAEEYASAMNVDLAIISKKRRGDTDVEVRNFIGDVKGKKVILIDDLTESAGTLIEAAMACKVEGAKEVLCAVSHGCFTDIGVERLIGAFQEDLIKTLYVSNSVKFPEKWIDKTATRDYSIEPVNYRRTHVKTVDMSYWFSEAIRNIHTNNSVSQLF